MTPLKCIKLACFENVRRRKYRYLCTNLGRKSQNLTDLWNKKKKGVISDDMTQPC